MKSIVSAFFFVLTSSYAFGGEWHSAGNAPVMPHKPSGIANYKCMLTAYTTVGEKTYLITEERVIEDHEFRGQNASPRITLKNTGDPGMDGQSLSLSFGQGTFEEMLKLSLNLNVEGRVSSNARSEVVRSAKVITVEGFVDIKNPRRGGVSSVRAKAECRDLN